MLKELERILARQAANVIDGLVPHRDRKHFGTQTRTMTSQARLFANVFLQTSFGVLVRRLDVAFVQDVAHARECGIPMRLVTVELAVIDTHLFGSQTIQKDLLHARRQIPPRRLGIDLEVQA